MILLSLFAAMLDQVYLLISYVSSVNSFPKPLEPAQEAMYLEQYAKGDMEARDQLIEHNLRLVAHIAKKYASTGKDMDDIISVGTVGLIKGISNYNLDRGTRLSTYISRCIENEILMDIRSSKKILNEVSIEEPIGFDSEGNQITFNDILSRDDDVIDEISNKIEVKKLYRSIIDTLCGRERTVIEMRYGLHDGNELTQRDIAKKLGISRSYVSRIEKKALEKIKNSLC